MNEKVAGVYTVRAIMRRGRVQLLDDVEIEEGSLLDVVVVRSWVNWPNAWKRSPRQQVDYLYRPA